MLQDEDAMMVTVFMDMHAKAECHRNYMMPWRWRQLPVLEEKSHDRNLENYSPCVSRGEFFKEISTFLRFLAAVSLPTRQHVKVPFT